MTIPCDYCGFRVNIGMGRKDGRQSHELSSPRESPSWYQIFGSALVQNTATDFAQLKAALSKAFPAIQNRRDLETRFYASQQRQNQEPTDFV
ncbi:uncharacterized protein TNCV_1220721 [Trichonephila clavipes]|nr:uncharacterized protein TNCV_1220721 [Trichonephila clavipes]